MLVHFLESWDLLSVADGVEQNPKSRVQTVISGSTCLHDLNPKQGPHKEYIYAESVSSTGRGGKKGETEQLHQNSFQHPGGGRASESSQALITPIVAQVTTCIYGPDLGLTSSVSFHSHRNHLVTITLLLWITTLSFRAGR